MRETDVINVSATGGSGYFALEVLQSMHGFEGVFINTAKLTLSGIVVFTSGMALLARDTNGDGVPDFIENARTIWRALFGRGPKK